MNENEQTIYVYLMNTKTDLWRPITAEPLGNLVFKILSDNQYPDDEEWQFTTGDVVRCEARTLFDCTHTGCLVVVEKIK